MPGLHERAVEELRGWSPPNAGQQVLRSVYLDHLHAHRDGWSRSCHPDHLTASMVVVDEARRRVLLTLHRRYEIWVQFGGHCEDGDDSLSAAALREATEESGIAGLRPLSDRPVQLSTHEVRCGPIRPAHHLDVRYAAEAPVGALPTVTSESLDVRWFDLDEAAPVVDASLRELIEWAARL